jgi:hypothetical protein
MTSKPNSKYPSLQARRKVLLTDLAAIDQLRRGSISEQRFKAKRRDGSTIARGPYPLLTRKQNGKTVSTRLTDPTLLPIYRQQIAQMRRFEAIIDELVRIGEELADLSVAEESEKKTLGPN